MVDWWVWRRTDSYVRSRVEYGTVGTCNRLTPFTWTGRRSAATFQSCTFDHSPAVPSMLVAIIAAQAQMRGSLHAHILVWFRRRELPSNFTHLSPIARDLKTTLPSRQRPRGHEVAPQPGQLKKGEYFQEDNVRFPPCNFLCGP